MNDIIIDNFVIVTYPIIDSYEIIQELKLDNTNNFTNECKSMFESESILNFTTYINFKNFIDDNKKSYNNNMIKINKQFDVDFNRQTFKLNSKTISSQEIFIDILSKNLTLTTKFCSMTCKEILLLLCCQSSFYLPYMTIKTLCKLDEEKFCLTCNGQLNEKTTEIVLGEYVMLKMSTTFFITDIEKNKNTHKIPTYIYVDINSKEIKKNHDNIVMFSWDIFKLKN